MSSLKKRFLYWFLLDSNRLHITAATAVGVFLLVFGLSQLDLVTVGYDSSLRTLLSSGVTSGLLALVTVSLSINQLVLSRVFGPPNELRDRYEGTMDLREQVAELASVSTTPTDPSAFVALLGETLHDQADSIEAAAEDHEPSVRAALEEHAEKVHNYARSIDEFDDESETTDVLIALLSGEYAKYVTETRDLQGEHDATLSEDVHDRLEEMLDSFEAIAITRQYLKTLAVQQELARLSRLIAYTGLVAILVTMVLTLVYTSGSGATVPPSVLPPLASAGIAVIVTPLVILIAYTLRIATVARYTVSAGPFTPPEEQLSSELQESDR